MAGEIKNRIDSQISKWEQNGLPSSQGQGSNFDINDTFEETGMDKGNLTVNVLQSAGLGIAAGVGLANKSELTKLKKQVEALEKKSAPHKSLYQKMMECVQGNKTEDSPISKLAKEILKEGRTYTPETQRSMFEYHFKEFMSNPEANSTEKSVADFALKEGKNLDEIFGFHHNKWYQKFLLSSYDETMKFLANPQNTQDSAGKTIINLYAKINKDLKEDKKGLNSYTTYQEPAATLNAALDSIIQSDGATYYEKSVASFWKKIPFGTVSLDRDMFIDDNHMLINGISGASEDSNPIQDMVNWTPKEHKLEVCDQIFKNIAASNHTDKADKDLAKLGLKLGVSRDPRDQFKEKYEFLKQFKPNPSIDLTKGLEKFVPH